MALPGKFAFHWHSLKITGAPELAAVEDIERELEQRRVREEQIQFMEAGLRRECYEFVEGYILSFRQEVAEFCDQVIAPKGQVRGRTLNSIRDRIDRFHAMNVFGDADTAAKLAQLKHQIASLTGQDLAQQPDVGARLSAACTGDQEHGARSGKRQQADGAAETRVVLD